MDKQGPSYNSVKKELVRGTKVTLPTGGPGIFMKTRKSMCEVLIGDMNGKLDCVDLGALIWATYGIRKKGK